MSSERECDRDTADEGTKKVQEEARDVQVELTDEQMAAVVVASVHPVSQPPPPVKGPVTGSA